MPLKAVTFDFHNTLADCDEWFQLEIRDLVPRFLDWLATQDGTHVAEEERAAALQHYRALRLQVMEHGVERDAYDCTSDVLAILGRDIDPAIVRSGVDDVMRSALAGSTPILGVVETVKSLKSHGIELAVVSSAVHHDFEEWSLEKFGIRDAFTLLVTSASSGFYKSRTEIYEYTLDRLGVSSNEAVHVGDSLRFDVATASRAGMRTVWYARNNPPDSGNGTDLTVTTIEGLAPLILDHFGTGS